MVLLERSGSQHSRGSAASFMANGAKPPVGCAYPDLCIDGDRNCFRTHIPLQHSQQAKLAVLSSPLFQLPTTDWGKAKQKSQPADKSRRKAGDMRCERETLLPSGRAPAAGRSAAMSRRCGVQWKRRCSGVPGPEAVANGACCSAEREEAGKAPAAKYALDCLRIRISVQTASASAPLTLGLKLCLSLAGMSSWDGSGELPLPHAPALTWLALTAQMRAARAGCQPWQAKTYPALWLSDARNPKLHLQFIGHRFILACSLARRTRQTRPGAKEKQVPAIGARPAAAVATRGSRAARTAQHVVNARL
ncbi:unnamed protein product [Symbiodinium natans]|uniref:Uncharacterized protein n=1 Tax=Symbiodinium natans TaxID=878477 RepID=A0A812QBK9_9DINO|nr:unnamed protein product [Symbiodinium natans]